LPGGGDALDASTAAAGGLQADAGGQDGGPDVVLAAKPHWKKTKQIQLTTTKGGVFYRVLLPPVSFPQRFVRFGMFLCLIKEKKSF
jgi:hypothetical protein